MNEYGFLMLAAGSSSRLGQPKQLLRFNGKPLLQHSIDIALAVNKGPVLTVLGANADMIKKHVTVTGGHIFTNDNWQEGMGSTIAYGVQRMYELHPEMMALIIMVCDQPLITPSLLNELIQMHEENEKRIVACAYGDSLGTPVLFERRFFNELTQLNGHGGAKKIIFKYPEDVAAMPFPDGNIDIDTADDYERLISK
jgi:molybdenum cofactor cytidylyltransferase